MHATVLVSHQLLSSFHIAYTKPVSSTEYLLCVDFMMCVYLLTINRPHTHTHTHPFNGHFSGTTEVSRYQKGKPIWILLKQETVSGSGISWAIRKSAPCSRQITTPAPHHSVFYRPDALPVAQPTASKQRRQINRHECIMSTASIKITLHESTARIAHLH